MVAPGMNLEFNYSPRFLARLDQDDPLAKLIRGAIENRPTGGKVVVGEVREILVEVEGCSYAVLFRRKGNTIGLMSIHDMPDELSELNERKAEYRDLFFKGAKR